jgi:hypothetical protein
MKQIVACVSVLVLATTVGAMQRPPEDLLARVDHLVYATPDLELGIQTIEKLTGVRASAGGQHPGLGTRNALIALGPSTYLEIIGPDPEQPKPDGPRRFGIDELKAPRLLTWVAKGTELAPFVNRARANGVLLGDVISGSRKRPDGVVLSWRYTDPNVVLEDRLVPYFIDWGTSPHPAMTAAPGLSLRALSAEHPEPERMARILKQLGLDLPVRRGAKPSLIATIDSPKGRIELRN